MIAAVISADDVGLHASKDTYSRGVLEGGGSGGSIVIVAGGRSNSYV